VLAVGDSAFQRKSAKKFEELRDGGRTVILVTHSMANIRNMCDHVAWLDRGKLVRVGEAKPVSAEYEEFMRSQ